MMDLPDGTKLPALADGEYDAIVLGTGLKECIISGEILQQLVYSKFFLLEQIHT